jgi:hypothetical protein
MAIVEACMDDLDSSDSALVRERLDGAYKPCLGISAAGLLSDRTMLLNHDGRSSISGSQLAGNRKANYSGAYYLDIFKVSLSSFPLHV